MLMCIPEDKVEHTLKTFSKYHSKIQFTHELGVAGRLNYLELALHNVNNILEVDWYNKKTFSDRFFNF